LLLPARLAVRTVVEVTLATPRGDFATEATVVWVARWDPRPPRQFLRHGLQFTAAHWVRDLILGLLLGEPPAGSS
jgi:hypothetical protein